MFGKKQSNDSFPRELPENGILLAETNDNH